MPFVKTNKLIKDSNQLQEQKIQMKELRREIEVNQWRQIQKKVNLSLSKIWHQKNRIQMIISLKELPKEYSLRVQCQKARKRDTDSEVYLGTLGNSLRRTSWIAHKRASQWFKLRMNSRKLGTLIQIGTFWKIARMKKRKIPQIATYH